MQAVEAVARPARRRLNGIWNTRVAAFLYADDRMHDLNDLLTPSAAARWDLRQAIRINDNGQSCPGPAHRRRAELLAAAHAGARARAAVLGAAVGWNRRGGAAQTWWTPLAESMDLPQGMRVTSRRSTSDQEGAGGVQVHCPVATVQDGLAAAGISLGKVTVQAERQARAALLEGAR